MPGDEIDMQIREQGWDWEYILYINGEEQKEEYIAEAMQQAGTIDYPFIVEENCYFVMGTTEMQVLTAEKQLLEQFQKKI